MATTHGLIPKHELDARLRRIGRLVAPAPDADPSTSAPTLALLRHHKGLPATSAGRLAPAIRVADADGRIKFSRAGLLSESLGWRPGCLSVLCDGPWLVLTQPAELVGVARRRNAPHAVFSRDTAGVERVGLAPAHLARVATLAGREVLLVVAPDSGVLVLASPLVALASVPAAVARVLEPATGEPSDATHRADQREESPR